MKTQTQAEQEMNTALRCLYIAVDSSVAKDVETKVRTRVAELENALALSRQLYDPTAGTRQPAHHGHECGPECFSDFNSIPIDLIK